MQGGGEKVAQCCEEEQNEEKKKSRNRTAHKSLSSQAFNSCSLKSPIIKQGTNESS